MSDPIALLPGSHLLPGRFADVEVTYGPRDLLVHRVGEVTNLATAGASPAMSLPATSLEIRMDQWAAMTLAANLCALARKMGWPHPTEGADQSVPP